jgi:hypothetical protein
MLTCGRIWEFNTMLSIAARAAGSAAHPNAQAVAIVVRNILPCSQPAL